MKAPAFLEFREPLLGVDFNMTPETAFSWFKTKGLNPTWSYKDLAAEEHDAAFTVAKMLDTDMLADVKGAVDQAIENGDTLAEFKKRLEPMLKAKGWWGKDAAGNRLGSAWRLETIFRTNIQQAYSVGHWEKIAQQGDKAPWLMYDAVDDNRTRPWHAALDNTIRRFDDPFWRRNYPPNGYNCRCSAIQLSDDELQQYGLSETPIPEIPTKKVKDPFTGKVKRIPASLDYGFDRNPGIARLDYLKRIKAEKAQALVDPKLRAAATSKKALEAEAKARAKAQTELSVQKALKDLAKAEGPIQMQRSIAKQARWAEQVNAKNKLEDLAAGKLTDPGKFKAKALDKLQKAGQLEGVKPADKLSKVEELAGELKQKKQTSDGLSKYKQAIVAGKNPPPAGTKALESLSDAEREAFLTKVGEAVQAKAAKEAEAAASKAAADSPATAAARQGPPDPVFRNLTQIGPQAGSNEGGLYLDESSGVKWYVKTPASADQARNEVLAAKLYEAAGAEVPDVRLIDVKGNQGVASRVIDGVHQDRLRLKSGDVLNVGDFFAADAWLANWDVVGLNYDNMLVKGSRAIRLDTGGALRYRAQGTLKGAAFGPKVNELETLRDSSVNPQAASVFRHATKAQIEGGVSRILAVSDEQIVRLVDEYGPVDAKAREQLTATLIARRDDLAAKFPNVKPAAKAAPAEPHIGEPVTPGEFDLIRSARGNGWSRPTDAGDVEDQQVVLYHVTNPQGQVETRAVLKLRGDAARQLEGKVKGSGVPVVGFEETRSRIVTAIKGIATRLGKGSPLEQKDLDRIAEAAKVYAGVEKNLQNGIEKGLFSPESLTQYRDHFRPWLDAVERAKTERKWDPPGPALEALPEPKPVAKGEAGLRWQKQTLEFRIAEQRNGQIVETNQLQTRATFPGYIATDGQGVTLRYQGSDAVLSVRNRLELRVAGNDRAAAAKLIEALKQLEVDSARPTDLSAEELYLFQIASSRTSWKLIDEAEAIRDQGERVAHLIAGLSKEIGQDVTQLPQYNPLGARQAFDHGRRVLMRPDLDQGALAADWAKFRKSYRVHHQFTSGGSLPENIDRILSAGGQMAPTTDKLRRGIPIGGMSPERDLQTGGASYFFTRIKSTRSARSNIGIVWNPEVMQRTDAISYSGDLYGAADKSTQRSYRAGTPAKWIRNGGSGGNETIFKESLSIFDGLDRIVTGSPNERDKVIEIFKRHGYDTFPDGRPLEDVVVVRGR